MPDIILYVHVPFCSSKCHFCSWVSPIPTTELVRAKEKFGTYASAVIQEIRNTAAQVGGRSLTPKLVYFGGGTPSLLSGGDLAGILNELFKHFPKNSGFLDTTLEMSPDTVTEEKLSTIRAAGFSRISFGVQSFNAQRARSIGRAHTPDTAIRAFDLARKAGFDNINIDLMIGFPEETEEEYRASVQTALMLDPDHLSVYVYKKIPTTVLARLIDTGKLTACPQHVAVERYERVSEMLARAGYSEYMFQLFHKGGKRCYVDQHYFNLTYDYIGFGQGAHMLLGGKYYGHNQSLNQYLQRPAPDYSVRAAESDSLLETKLFEMMHTEGGIDFERFSKRLGIAVPEALQKFPMFRRALQSVIEDASCEQTSSGLRLATRDARLKWLALPPYWSTSEAPIPNQESLVSIAAAV